MEPTFRHLIEAYTFWRYHISTYCKSGPLTNASVGQKHKGTKMKRHFENAVCHFKGAGLGKKEQKTKQNKNSFWEALANELSSLDNIWEFLHFSINIYMENAYENNASCF